MEKVFDYIAHGGTEADKQAASMAYLEGVLGGVIKERDELAAENERLRAALEPSKVLYALEHAGFVVSDNELENICRKLGINQQSTQQEK